MATANISNYSKLFQELVWFSIKTKFRNNECMIRISNNNEIMIFFKDELNDQHTFPFFDKNIRYLYCSFETKEEFKEALSLVTQESYL